MSSWPIAGSEFVEGLSVISVRRLPEHERECALCQTPYELNAGGKEAPVQLPCRHKFGDRCLYNYMSESQDNNNTCPTCGAISYNKLYRYVVGGDLVESEEYQEPSSTTRKKDYENIHEHSLTESEVNEAIEREEQAARQYENTQRLKLAATRRTGSLHDRATYRELLAGGVDLPPLASTDLLLNVEQDRALFEELQRGGAFVRSGPFMEQFEDYTDFEIYEILRDRGLGWSHERRRWVLNEPCY